MFISSICDITLKKRFLIGAFFWSLAIAVSLAWNIYANQAKTKELAALEARALFNKDKAFRFWGASHGGVYVPISEDAPPNPFLAHVPERDINTSSGKQLTLMNPAYMVRQMMEKYEELYGVKGRITSFIHFRPETAPDEWEKMALKRFAKGEMEVVEFSDIDGRPYLRLMQPLFTDKSCLKCHGFQGYKEGDVRGGVSVSLPIEKYIKEQDRLCFAIIVSHLFFWSAGVAAVFLFAKRLDRQTSELAAHRDRLEEIVAKRTEDLQAERLRYRMVADFTHDWESWIDKNGGWLYCSPSSVRITGYAPKEFIENPNLFLEIIHPDDRRVVSEHLHERHCIGFCERSYLSFRIFHKDGRTIWIEHVCQSVFDEDGTYLGQRASNRDITERKAAEQNLKTEIDKRNKIEEKMLSQAHLAQMGGMLTMIAHHWRQPLAAISLIIQNFLDSYRYGELSEEELEGGVTKAMSSLESLSATLATLSNLASRQKESILFDASETTKKLCDLAVAEMQSFFIDFSFELEDNVTILGAPVFYTQAFIHILSNAKEATLEKSVNQRRIVVTLAKWNGTARLMIEDSGGGVEPSILPRLFEPFFTTKSVATKTGLGLYIVKLIMEQQFRGGVEVENCGDGAMVTLLFPKP